MHFVSTDSGEDKKMNRMYDVIVVGAGPGGSVAAKQCAERGLRTLLLEKKRLPRKKVCTGMVMGPWARAIIEAEFGTIPDEVLVKPYRLSGHAIRVRGAVPQFVPCVTPITWREDLDMWMVSRTKEKGVGVWDEVKVISFSQDEAGCVIRAMRGTHSVQLRSKFVIGADGAASVVRAGVAPGLRMRYSTPLRFCYQGSLDVAQHYCHWFFPTCSVRPRFDLIHKGDGFLLEGSGLRVLKGEIAEILSPFGFEPGWKPTWKDGCVMPLLHAQLLSGEFRPAEGNALLVGDAAGLVFPVTFEGIGAALKSGQLAAESVSEAAESGVRASDVYMNRLGPVFRVIARLQALEERLARVGAEGPSVLALNLKAAYEEALQVA
jgi:flavin-dependent dehydrogenase